MKKTNEIIKQIVQKINHQQILPSQQLTQAKFDLIPIQFTGMVEDHMFRQNQQIYDMLRNQTDQDIQGLKYQQIYNNSFKNQYFRKMKQNLPKYYNLKPNQRQLFFKNQGDQYYKKLGINQLQKISINQIQQQKLINSQTCKKKILTPQKLHEKVDKKFQKIIKKQIKKQTKNQISKQTQTSKNLQVQAQKQKQEQIQSVQYRQIIQNCKEVIDSIGDQIWKTPQKNNIRKKVKFLSFQTVKDFSQYKTPKKIAKTEFLIQPLKDIQQEYKQQS